VNDKGDLRIIRPLVFVRERVTRAFAEQAKLPIITENCPACFAAPTERHRAKLMLAAQEQVVPDVFSSILRAIKPIMRGSLAELGQKRGRDEESKEEDCEECVFNPV
jgi:tRNA 2-thiocytidine biosynthesis protein TtcA